MKAYPEYKDSGVEWLDAVPADWIVAPIGFAGSVTLGKMLQSAPASSADVEAPYMRAANVQPDGVLALKDVKNMWFSPSEVEGLEFSKGDIAVVEGGVGGFGRAAFVAEDLRGWGFQNSINRIRPFDSTDGRYLTYCLIAMRVAGWIRAYCNIVSMPHLTAEKLTALRVTQPPLPEQRAIAAYLDRETAQIDELIGEQEALIDSLTERRQGVLDTSTRSAHGDEFRLRHLYTPSSEANSAHELVLSVYREFGVIPKGSRDGNNNKTPENLVSYLLVQPSDLVVNKMKAWQGSLGVSSHRGIVSPDYEVLRPTTDRLAPRYAHYALRAPYRRAEFRSLSKGIRPAQWRLYWDQLGDVRLTVPPLNEQTEIIDYLDTQTSTIDSLTTECRELISLLKERRSALISAAVTGKIDVRGFDTPLVPRDYSTSEVGSTGGNE